MRREGGGLYAMHGLVETIEQKQLTFPSTSATLQPGFNTTIKSFGEKPTSPPPSSPPSFLPLKTGTLYGE